MIGALPPDMEAGPVAEMGGILDGIVEEHGVAIPLAIESGSRAWGFPSPDSDYDCRFVYIRPASDTFTLFPRRDVIEYPMSALIDVSGWELSKALRLLLRGNAVIIEWLTSPFAYRLDAEFQSAFLELAVAVADRNLVARHYFHLAEGQAARFLDRPGDVALKKLLYVLRPLMALQWLAARPSAAVAPMNFSSLVEGVDLDEGLRREISGLLKIKRSTRELGTGTVPAPIHDFMVGTLRTMEPFREAPATTDVTANERIADDFWRNWIVRLAPG
jgi:predicted nucleotidyltransferase